MFLLCTILEAQASCSTETTTTLTTTTIFLTTCPYGDRFRPCHLIRFYDHCEMLYGSCDCESGRTTCCESDQCIAKTVPSTSTSFILIEK
jgi:hypothetical protein